MFEKIKKLFKKENKKMATTLEEVRKAYEDLSEDDKKSFHQSLSDRVHESIAAQERADGNEDSQSAEAREHEALGEEHAEGKGEVEELHEADDTPEEKAEDKKDEAEEKHEEVQNEKHELNDARLDALEKSVGEIKEMLSNLGKSSVEEKAKETYGLGNGVFQGEEKAPETKKMNANDIASILNRIKR